MSWEERGRQVELHATDPFLCSNLLCHLFSSQIHTRCKANLGPSRQTGHQKAYAEISSKYFYLHLSGTLFIPPPHFSGCRTCSVSMAASAIMCVGGGGGLGSKCHKATFQYVQMRNNCSSYYDHHCFAGSAPVTVLPVGFSWFCISYFSGTEPRGVKRAGVKRAEKRLGTVIGIPVGQPLFSLVSPPCPEISLFLPMPSSFHSLLTSTVDPPSAAS